MPDFQALMGFDFGLKRIGVAFGQTITQTASPIAIVDSDGNASHWPEIEKLIKQWKPSALVVGIPLDMQDVETPITKAAKVFSQDLLNRFDLPVHEIDEKLSSISANERLIQLKKKGHAHRKIDAHAACIILETWMKSV